MAAKQKVQEAQYRNRIKEVKKVYGRDILPSPFNWRTHPDGQKKALRSTLTEIGIAGVPLCYYGEDGQLYTLDGHCRMYEVGADVEWTVAILDITEAEAKKLIAVYDPISEMAQADPQKLQDLLSEIEFDNTDLSDLCLDIAADNGVIFGSDEAQVKDKFEQDASDSPIITAGLPTQHVCPKCQYTW